MKCPGPYLQGSKWRIWLCCAYVSQPVYWRIVNSNVFLHIYQYCIYPRSQSPGLRKMPIQNMFNFVHSYKVTLYFSDDEFVKEIIILCLDRYGSSWSMIMHRDSCSVLHYLICLCCCFFVKLLLLYCYMVHAGAGLCNSYHHQRISISVSNLRTDSMLFIHRKCSLVLKLL
jgi:hypothetical protein